MNSFKALMLLSASATVLGMTGTASAQTADTAVPPANAKKVDAGDQSEDIVVTAQKRSERITNVPLSIDAASGDQLASQGITSATQLDKIVPGFTYQATTFGTPVFAIRGIGFFDSAIGASPTVTVYTDQVPLPFLVMTRGATLDLERVEALKGPQGTLFGQNSTGGAINYVTAKPTDDLHAGFRIDTGRFSTVNSEAYVSGRLVEGLTARIAGRYEYRDGWQVSQSRPGDTYGGDRFYSGRLLLDWQPSDKLIFELNINGWNDRQQIQAPQFVAFAPQAARNPFNGAVYTALSTLQPAPDDARIADWDANRTESSNSDFYQFSLRGDATISEAVTLTSITAYSHYKTLALADIDGTAFDDLYYAVHGKIRSFSQELRLDGTMGRLRWMVGGNYQNDVAIENRENLLHSTNNGVGPFRYSATTPISRQDIRTVSGFGSLEYEIADHLTLEASARYSDQKRDFAGCLSDNGNGTLAAAFSVVSSQLSGSPTTIAPGACVSLNDDPNNTTVPLNKPLPIVYDTLAENNVSWRLGINWKPSSDTLVYANATKGYKSGNYSILPAALASQLAPVRQESVMAYEVGLKQALAGRAIQFNGAVFYYDYTDKQLLGAVLVVPFGNLPKLVNIPESRVWGAEAELVLRPVQGFRISTAVTYVNSKVKNDPANPRDPLGNSISFVGQRFPNTPQLQGIADVEYDFPLNADLNLTIGANVNYRSASYATFGELPQFRIPGYALLDLRAKISSPDDRWALQIWGRNITNKFYLTSVQRPIDTITRFTGMPVTYGVTLSFKY